MTKNLVIVESPTKSKTIEKFLGRNYTVRASMAHFAILQKVCFGVLCELVLGPKYFILGGKAN